MLKNYLKQPARSNYIKMFTSCIKMFSCDSKRPLKDIRILDLSRIVAGPYCSMILGDLGAEVIKVEKPGTGDETRNYAPPFANNSTESCYFIGLNRNKKSICLDIKSNEGKNIITDLSKKCDILIENFVPGKLNKLGLDYESLKKVSPHLIYCSITGYGSQGPYKEKPGYDVVAASYGGLLSITGPRSGPHCKVGVAMTDLATGLYAHGAILAALIYRAKTGKGQKIDCNLFSTQVACLINIGSNYLNANVEGEKWGSSHASIVPYKIFKTLDDHHITIGAGSDSQFKELCKKLKINFIAESPEYKHNKDRVKNRYKLDQILQDTLKTKTLQEWLGIFEGSSFPYGPVNKISEVFSDKHIKEIGLVSEINHAVAGKIKLVGPPVNFSECQNKIYLPPPILGEHTIQVLKEILNYSDSKINFLKKKGANVATVRLKLKKPKSRKKVNWTQETVDNENMDKKKSKCCCIYKKPRLPNDSSSSEDENECEHCQGHVEKRKNNSKENSLPELSTQQMVAS